MSFSPSGLAAIHLGSIPYIMLTQIGSSSNKERSIELSIHWVCANWPTSFDQRHFPFPEKKSAFWVTAPIDLIEALETFQKIYTDTISFFFWSNLFLFRRPKFCIMSNQEKEKCIFSHAFSIYIYFTSELRIPRHNPQWVQWSEIPWLPSPSPSELRRGPNQMRKPEE